MLHRAECINGPTVSPRGSTSRQKEAGRKFGAAIRKDGGSDGGLAPRRPGWFGGRSIQTGRVAERDEKKTRGTRADGRQGGPAVLPPQHQVSGFRTTLCALRPPTTVPAATFIAGSETVRRTTPQCPQTLVAVGRGDERSRNTLLASLGNVKRAADWPE
jgi:hypothetical protein